MATRLSMFNWTATQQAVINKGIHHGLFDNANT
jgi:hypothetical protein